MSKRRIRRKRRARVKILPLILVGAVIAGVITVIMSVNLKGADKEPPTEEIYITEILQATQAENTEPVTKTEQEAKLEHDLNYTYPYNVDFKYRMQDIESDHKYNLVPAEYGKSVALAKLVKFLWLQSYEELMDDNGEFIKTYCPKIITLIGSKAYNPDSHSVVLGTAEGGLKVVLYNVNELDTENPDVERVHF